MAQWAAGALQGDTIEATALANSNALGRVTMLNELVELTGKELEEGLKDE